MKRLRVVVVRHLVDRFGRPVRRVRISVTNSCNYSCFFCHREGHPGFGRVMRVDEIGRIARVLVGAGIDIVKITGGEPLVRRDICDIVGAIREAGAKEISMVTNGWYLADLAGCLKSRGLDRVNISIHSFDREIYKKITGVDGLERALRAVRVATEVGLQPKVNMVVLKGFNDRELWRAIDYAAKMGVNLQLIELLDFDGSLSRFRYDLGKFEEELRRMGLRIVRRELHLRPRYYLDGGNYVEVVRGSGNPTFCMNCDRIRITADGYFKTCIMRDDNLVDFLGPMRRGASDEELRELLLKAVMLREPFYKP